MFYALLKEKYLSEMTMLSIILAFMVSLFAMKYFKNLLPQDNGRAFAVNGQLSRGKPRGAGIILILVFLLIAALFIPTNNELLAYAALLFATMLSGFLDDGSTSSWNEYVKGIIDLIIAIASSITFVNFNPDSIGVQLFDKFIPLPAILFIFLMTVLIWVSINVTNCADGVDGLCGSLSIVSLLTIYLLFEINNLNPVFSHIVLLMVACILGYLWFNISPSKLLMGDAGSRAIGFFIAITVVKSNSPLLYLLIAFMLVLDGGLGLLKVFLIRLFKIYIFKNVKMPLHDYVRKDKGWSDSEVVFRFVAIQALISFVLIYTLVK